jgi:subtilisin family serine protease
MKMTEMRRVSLVCAIAFTCLGGLSQANHEGMAASAHALSGSPHWLGHNVTIEPVALRIRKFRNRNRPRDHQPPQTKPDKPGQNPPHDPPPSSHDAPGHKPPNGTSHHEPRKKRLHVRGKLLLEPRVICIDGKMAQNRCQCASGARPVPVATRILRCVAAKEAATRRSGVAAVVPLAAANAPAVPANGDEPRGPRDLFAAREVLVALRLSTPASLDGSIARRYGLQIVESWPVGLVARRLVRYQIPDGRSPDAVLSAMRGDGQILETQPNYLYRRQGDRNETGVAQLQYALAKLHVPAAHELTRGRGATVALLDSGVDGSHQDLREAVAAIFAVSRDAERPPTDAHGTEMAGIIAAHGMTQGVAPDARLLDVRVFDYRAGTETVATTLSMLRGLDWAAGKGARIINMSLEGPADRLMHEAVEALARQDVIMIAAAGNGGTGAPPAYPAAYADVIAVTATDQQDRIYEKSNRGVYVDVAAPGVDILSPGLAHVYGMTSGTSAAAAHVSGVIALMLALNPSLKAREIMQSLAKGALDLGQVGVDTDYGAGLVNAMTVLRPTQ